MRASILPIMIDPYGNAFFLLGRQKSSSWVEGCHVWSDFGGRAKNESIEETAAREFIEESNGVLVSPEDLYLFVHSLKTFEYVVRIHNTFVVRFQWNPSLEYTFQQTHTLLSSLHAVCSDKSLTKTQRIALASLPWIKGKFPSTIVQALKTRHATLPRSVIQEMQRCMNADVGTHAIVTDGPPLSCTLIQYVKREWLEKDTVRLFSIPQLKSWLSCVGLTCPMGQHLEIDSQFKEVLRIILSSLQFAACKRPL